MAERSPQPQAAPQFPYWPLSCMNFYSHAARDFGRYAQAVTKATDPLGAVRAEGDYGVRLFHDLMQAYYELALMPFTVMTGALAGQTGISPAEPDAPPAKPAVPGRA